ncbi:DNA-binding protein [Carnobacterium maltaromaticum]|uniref:DNA-binding protein n=1 Tax=Carnobacterium maltaromaticum TaxID=2751 RepID=UPI00295E2C46|nr:DNA-binding protein [Carnobacterium maltaromaticum]
MGGLSESRLERQNILNNKIAMKEAESIFSLSGIEMDGVIYYTRQQIVSFFDVDIRTIERVTEDNKVELEANGLQMLSGKKLKEFKIKAADVTDIDVGHKVVNLSISSFRTLLNYAMLLQNSEQAKIVRSTILDIVIDVMNKKVGGNTKYINQRDEDYIQSVFINENYRKQYTDALKDYLDMGQAKYALYTDKIYQEIFKERAKEYKTILKLNKNDRVRETMYSEIIDLVSAYESGLAECMKKKYIEKGNKKITPQELNKRIKS